MLKKIPDTLRGLPLMNGRAPYLVIASLPIFITGLDVYFRAGYLAVLEPRGITNYVISFFFEIFLAAVLFKLLSLLRGRAKAILLPVILFMGAGILLVYGHYHYFGVLPNDYSLNYMIEHFDDTKTLIAESVTPAYIAAYLLLCLVLAVISAASLRAARRIGRRPSIAFGILLTAMLFFLNNNVRFNPASYSYSASTIFTVKYFLQKKYFGGDFQLERGYVKRQFTVPATANKPLRFNIILIVSESVQRNNLQYYGYSRPTAPFIDSITRAGGVIAFDRHYSNAVSTQFCLPIMFSGIFAIDKVNAPYVYDYIKARTGARTAYFSSQAMQKDNIDLVFNTSLDTFVCQENSGLPVFNDRGVDDFPMIAGLIRYMRSSSGNPCFAVLQLNNTHYPYKISRGHNRKFTPAKPASLNAYDNTLVEQDELLRDLFAGLQASNLLSNTLIVFTSDHGEAFNQHKHSGHLLTLYNEDTAVPLWFRLPSSFSEHITDSLRQNIRANTSHIDILPTILDMVGLPSDSLLPKHAFGASLLKKRAGNIVPLVGKDMIDTKGVVAGNLKFIVTHREGRTLYEAYDLTADWSETKNIWKTLDGNTKKFLTEALEKTEKLRKLYDRE